MEKRLKNKKPKGDYLINGAVSTWDVLKINRLQTVMDNNSKVYVLEGVASKKQSNLTLRNNHTRTRGIQG
jgi:hypothetical protein